MKISLLLRAAFFSQLDAMQCVCGGTAEHRQSTPHPFKMQHPDDDGSILWEKITETRTLLSFPLNQHERVERLCNPLYFLLYMCEKIWFSREKAALVHRKTRCALALSHTASHEQLLLYTKAELLVHVCSRFPSPRRARLSWWCNEVVLMTNKGEFSLYVMREAHPNRYTKGDLIAVLFADRSQRKRG